jgi:hypothetical protein
VNILTQEQLNLELLSLLDGQIADRASCTPDLGSDRLYKRLNSLYFQVLLKTSYCASFGDCSVEVYTNGKETQFVAIDDLKVVGRQTFQVSSLSRKSYSFALAEAFGKLSVAKLREPDWVGTVSAAIVDGDIGLQGLDITLSMTEEAQSGKSCPIAEVASPATTSKVPLLRKSEAENYESLHRRLKTLTLAAAMPPSCHECSLLPICHLGHRAPLSPICDRFSRTEQAEAHLDRCVKVVVELRGLIRRTETGMALRTLAAHRGIPIALRQLMHFCLENRLGIRVDDHPWTGLVGIQPGYSHDNQMSATNLLKNETFEFFTIIPEDGNMMYKLDDLTRACGLVFHDRKAEGEVNCWRYKKEVKP